MIRPGRVRRVREAIKRHGEEMRAAIQAMDQAQTAQDELPILSANGGVPIRPETSTRRASRP